MVESSLSDDLLKAWQRYIIITKKDSGDVIGPVSIKSYLSLLMEFLKREVSGEERLKLVISGFSEILHKEKFKEKLHKRDTGLVGLFNAKENSRLFCSNSSESKDCNTVKSLSLQERTVKFKRKQLLP